MQRSVFSLFWAGYRAAMPLMIGVAPFGAVFGVLAVNAGMSTIQTLGMSVIVLAGSAQFVATELIAHHAPITILVLTTFVINLRHFLYSASLESFLRPLPLGWKALLGYIMVDEVYATVMAKHQQRELSPDELRWYFVGSGASLISIWWLATLIGAQIGNIMSNKVTEALGFTLPLVFISIVVPMLVNRPALLAALSAGGSAIILAPLPHKLGLLAAAGIGILTGVISEGRRA